MAGKLAGKLPAKLGGKLPAMLGGRLAGKLAGSGVVGVGAKGLGSCERESKPPDKPNRFLNELCPCFTLLSELDRERFSLCLSLPFSFSFIRLLSFLDRDLDRDRSFFFFERDLDLPFFLDRDLCLSLFRERDLRFLLSLLDRVWVFFSSSVDDALSRLRFLSLSLCLELEDDLPLSLSLFLSRARFLSLSFLPEDALVSLRCLRSLLFLSRL